MGSELNTSEDFQSLLGQLTNSNANQRRKAVEILFHIRPDQEIPSEFLHSAISALQQINPEENGEERGRIDSTISNLQLILAQPLFKDLEKFDPNDTQNGVLSPQTTNVLHQLSELNSRVVVRDLINRWVAWIAMGQRQLLVDAIAEQLRTNPYAVLPLVENFAKDLELTSPLRSAIIRQTIAPAYHPAIKHFMPDLLDDIHEKVNAEEDLPRLLKQVVEFLKLNPLDEDLREKIKPINEKDWPEQAQGLLDSLTARSPEFKERKRESEGNDEEDQALVNKAFEPLFLTERARREGEVYRRISSQLAHMSDKRFYDPDQKRYKCVKAELIKHAVPVVVFRLPERRDLETRWHVGLMLGYVGGRVAIDPLVRALIGEESARAARQQLLHEYYLEPSERLRQEAAEILDQAVEDARSSMKLLRRLNGAVFFTGIALIFIGIAIATVGGDSFTRLVGFISGLGGLAGIVHELLNDPLDRIQNAVVDLVQVETAFTSFIWELNLNNTYIQSQYVAKGILTDGEISQTMKHMEDAMENTMKKVQAYTTKVVGEKKPKTG